MAYGPSELMVCVSETLSYRVLLENSGGAFLCIRNPYLSSESEKEIQIRGGKYNSLKPSKILPSEITLLTRTAHCYDTYLELEFISPL